MAAPCQPTPISTIYETTTVTSLVPTTSGSTTYVLVDPAAETVSTTFRTRNGALEPVRTTILGATITTTEALTVTQTSFVVTSVPVSTVLNSCPVVPTSSTATSSSTSTSSTASSTIPSTTSSSTTTTSSTTSSTSSTLSSTSTSSSTLPTSSSLPSSQISSSSSSASSSSTGLLPSNASNASGSSSSSPSNLAAIIGGSVGGGVGAIILLGLLFWCCCARNRRKDKDHDEWRDPPPFLVGTAATGHGSGEFEEKEGMNGGRWDPAANNGHSGGRLSRKYVGAGAGAALAGGVSAYERNQEGGDTHRRKSGKFRPADEQDAYYRNTWIAPQPEPEPSRQEPPINAGFAGVGAGRAAMAGGAAGGIAASRIAPQPQRKGTVVNMMENATTFDPRARDGGWKVANEAFNQPGASSSSHGGQSHFQPRNPMPPPAPLPLPGIDYRSNVQNSSASHSTDTFLVPPSQSRFNRYNSPSQQPRNMNQTNGYDSPAPSHVSIPALGPYHASNESERGGNQLRVTNLGSSTQDGSNWGADSPIGGASGNWNQENREEVLDDNDPYGGLDAGLDHHRQQRY
ncbi:hypothetical protein JCM3765_005654 [Sporobolomyces pararoseus]